MNLLEILKQPQVSKETQSTNKPQILKDDNFPMKLETNPKLLMNPKI